MTKEDAISILEEFRDKHLSGKIDNLKHFTFDCFTESDFYEKEELRQAYESLYSDVEESNYLRAIDCKPLNYLKGSFSFGDEDEAYIIRVIYFLLWGNKLPNLEKFESLSGGLYRGDVINTYNTLFGSPATDTVLLDKYNLTNVEKENIKLFYRKYNSIGNFHLLPSIVGQGSLNQWRGRCLGDYFDKFLFELNKCLIKDDTARPDLCKIIDNYDWYFKVGDKYKTIQELAQMNFWEDYLDGDKIKFFSNSENGYYKFNSGKKLKEALKTSNPNSEQKILKDRYLEFRTAYIKQSSKIIDNRAGKMIEKLKPLLKKES